MAVLLWLLGLLLGLLLLLLVLPVDLSGRLDGDLRGDESGENVEGSVQWQLQLQWGRGAFRVRLTGRGLSLAEAAVTLLGRRLRAGPARAGPRRPPAPRRPPPRLPLAVIRALIQEAWRFLLRAWRDLGLRLRGDLVYGLGDPALTGACEALLWAVGRPEAVQLTPDWLDPRFDGWLEAEGQIFGVQLLIASLAFIRNSVLRRHFFSGMRVRLPGRRAPSGCRV